MHKRFVLLLAAAATMHAAVPTIREVYPRGAQRGKTFTLYLRGDGLTPGALVKTTLPASFSKLTLSKDPLAPNGTTMRPNAVLPFLVEIKETVPTGVYPIRVLTPDGISNVVLFSVGDLPETEEVESRNPKQPNNFPNEAQKVQTPAVINGTLEGADIDTYSFQAKAGEKLVFEVEARRAGSAIDPAVEIFDAAGKEIARNNDAPGLGLDSRVEVAFAKAGEYRIQVHDAKFSEQSPNYYRLKIGSFAYADTIFPLGGKRGEKVEVTLSGGNLPKPVKVQADLNTKSSVVFLHLPGNGGTPIPFAVSDSKEVVGPAELAPGVVLNGRIEKPGTIDKYRLALKPGQKWVFEVEAASLGTSLMDGILTLRDAKGKKLASADDGNGVDPILTYTVPDGVPEATLEVEDLLGRGGSQYAYRLVAKQQEPDFVVDLLTPYVNVPAGGTVQVACLVQRRGYDGEIKLSIPNLPAGFHAAGGNVPSEAAQQLFNDNNAGRRTARSVITITADSDVKQQSIDLSVMAQSLRPGTSIRRKARGPGLITAVKGDKQKAFTAPWLDIDLPMAVTTPMPATIEVSSPLVRMAQGFEYDLGYKVVRREGAKAAKPTLQIAGAVGNLRILKQGTSKNPDTGSFQVNTNFATPFTTIDLLLESQVEVDGKTVTVTSPVVEVEVAPGYEVRLSKSTLQLTPGGKMEIAGTVRREPTFEGGEVRIEPQELPDHVTCPAVMVPADQKQFTLVCQAGAGATPGSFDIRIASTAPNTGRKAKQDYKGPELNAKLVVGNNSGDR